MRAYNEKFSSKLSYVERLRVDQRQIWVLDDNRGVESYYVGDYDCQQYNNYREQNGQSEDCCPVEGYEWL